MTRGWNPERTWLPAGKWWAEGNIIVMGLTVSDFDIPFLLLLSIFGVSSFIDALLTGMSNASKMHLGYCHKCCFRVAAITTVLPSICHTTNFSLWNYRDVCRIWSDVYDSELLGPALRIMLCYLKLFNWRLKLRKTTIRINSCNRSLAVCLTH